MLFGGSFEIEINLGMCVRTFHTSSGWCQRTLSRRFPDVNSNPTPCPSCTAILLARLNQLPSLVVSSSTDRVFTSTTHSLTPFPSPLHFLQSRTLAPFSPSISAPFPRISFRLTYISSPAVSVSPRTHHSQASCGRFPVVRGKCRCCIVWTLVCNLEFSVRASYAA